MWTIVHCFCFTAIIDALVLSKARLSLYDCTKTVIISALTTTPAMMLLMGPFQLHQLRVDFSTMAVTQLPGQPDAPALGATIVAFFVIGCAGLGERRREMKWLLCQPRWDRVLAMMTMAYCSGLVALMVCGTPEAVVATGIHQQYGACRVLETDLSGYPRYSFLCKDEYQEDFRIPDLMSSGISEMTSDSNMCGDPNRLVIPQLSSTWYTLCGKAHTNYGLWVTTEAALAFLCTLSYSCILLTTRDCSPKTKTE